MAVATDIHLTYKVAPNDSALMGRVDVLAERHGRPSRPLRLQALLQLPRIASHNGTVSQAAADALVEQLAREMPAAEEWCLREHIPSPRVLTFGEVGQDEVVRVMERFHYLRSPRSDGPAYGLFTKNGSSVAVCTISPLDVAQLRNLLVARSRRLDRARVLSRSFAFEGSPKNTISYLLARVVKEERQLGPADYVTYVNPNLGFSGSSYLASGWRLLGDEPGTKYRYLDGRYISDRRLRALFGDRHDEGYVAQLGGRFSVSRMPLAPLLVFHRASATTLKGLPAVDQP